jgi:hypothetical protein
MTLVPAFSVAALVALGGCAALQHHPDDSFAHTAKLAEAAEPDARLDLARMYADPAAWPQAAGRQPEPALAAKWCVILSAGPVPTPAALARGPSCQQILASLPPETVAMGEYLASVQREGPGGSRHR